MLYRHCMIWLLAASSLCACLRDDDPPGGVVTPDPKVYTMGTPVAYATELEGLSAICLNEAGDGLLVAEDNGHIYEFGLDGKLKGSHTVPNQDGRDKVDLEGITRSLDGTTFYLCEERFREVWQLGSDHTQLTLLSKGPEESGSELNQGYEGIAAGDGVLYVANQSKPKRVYTYSLKTNQWGTAFDAEWASSLSDIYYDKEDGTLWITDAKTQKLTQLKTDGTVLHEYSISFVKKPEGFCKDPAGKRFWFVCDKTSSLYSVSYQ